jgi:hypothetical protein
MKKWFVIIGIITILLIVGYLFASYYAVKFIQVRLQKVVGPGLTIAEIEIKPTYLFAKGIQYEDPLSKRKIFLIEEMRVYPALFSFLKGTLNIRECMILRPSFFFYRSREGSIIGPWTTVEKREKGKEISEDQERKEKGREIADDRERKGKEPIAIKINRFRIRKGSVDFEDKEMGEPPAQIQLRELDLELKNIQYPFISSHSFITLKGKINGGKKEGSIYTEGWVDLKNVDMETSFKVQEVNIKIFEPYYRKRVSAEIEEGYMNLETKIGVKQRMIDAPGQLELVDLHIKEGGTILWIPAKTLVSLLKDKGNRIRIQFHVKGNMDDPKFNLQETFLTRVALSLAEVLGIPIKVVGESVIKGAGKGTEGLIEGLKSIEKLFKRKKEEKR